MTRFLAVVVSAAILTVGPTRAQAQQRPEPAGPGTITGLVLDPFGRGVDSSDVYIAELKIHKTVGADGRFRFDSIADGTYTVVARHVGYFAAGRKVTMEPQGVFVGMRLSPIVRHLPTVVSSAPRGGISGVIGDTAYNVIQGAKIEIAGESRRAVSDSAGTFLIPVPVGKHMIAVRKEGYITKMVSVTVPSDSGRRILVWLTPGTNQAEARFAFNLEALTERLERRSAAYSSIMTREDINKSGMTDLYDLAIKGAQHGLRDDCPAIVDGGPQRVPLWSLKAADIEMLEVYQARRASYNSTNMRANNNRMSSARPPDCEQVWVWLRK
ncbi:MAG TPA: carboxypeptidase-like regulatory domain-containing protein [Gemmatimonadaceae bacterium]